ncbi:hypothetical protein SLEP1_g22518 [Rubroshorea leprosula]|uniref:Uncharacterized protein n=1 Tax=Rubroshorea leprosula TaxID=152421 RepID=A0AAV5JIA5_9ROSI|nr:hypothetical protein SLEP1_g22518 [Rubroshorea leprosula]
MLCPKIGSKTNAVHLCGTPTNVQGSSLLKSYLAIHVT